MNARPPQHQHQRAKALLLRALCCWFMALPTGIQAQPVPACEQAYQACVGPCGRVIGADAATCQPRCVARLLECRQAARQPGTQAAPAAAPNPAHSPAVVPPAPRPEVPMSSAEIATAARTVDELRQRRAREVLQGAREDPPECRRGSHGMMASAEACISARATQRYNAQQEDRNGILRAFLPVEASLDLELSTLPAAAVERVRALWTLREKYMPVASLLENIRMATRGPAGENPVFQLADRFAAKPRAALREAQADPAVIEAVAAGQLQIGQLALTPAEATDWSADLKLAHMRQALRRELGVPSLFADRAEAHTRSAREASDAGNHARWGEPTDTEIGLALLRTYAAVDGRQTLPYETERTLPLTVLAAALGAVIQDVMRVVHVQKVRPCTRDGARWNCSVKLWIMVFQRGPGMRVMDGQNRHPLMRVVQAANAEAEAANGEPTTLRLQATAEGWTLPEQVEQIRASNERVYAMLDRVAQARLRAQCQAQAYRRWGFLNPSCSTWN